MSTALEELLPLLAQIAAADSSVKTLSDLSDEDGRSPFHLQRLFRAEIGESPLQFRRRVQLQRAAASLWATEKSVLQVALDSGFESHEGFSRAFKTMFGVAPVEFRKRIREAHQNDVDPKRHLETSHRTAPCVGLYRVELGGQKRRKSERKTMSHEVSKKTLTETPFLYIERQAKQEDISNALGAMFGQVFQYATAKGLPFGGPPTARYMDCGPGLFTIRAGLPIAGECEGDGEIVAGSLPGGPAATTMHKGPYERLSEAHEAIQNWIKENSEEAGGAPWEMYVTDPGEVPNPEDWLTEINWPLKAE